MVDALDSIELMGQTSLFSQSGFSATTFNAGDAGNVTVKTSRLAIRDGANVNSSTLATGNAGSVTINARDVEVSGRVLRNPNPSLVGSSAPIVVQTLQAAYRLPPKPSGDAGNVTINTDNLRVTDGALVGVRNARSGNAGTLRVNASSIFLDNQGDITAATASGVGGNISLEAQNLLALRGSDITATAGGRGNGGNITIDTDTLVALENSDITANAEQSFGGRVSINAQAIFGTQFRETPSSESDITASGGRPELSGTVEINTPDVAPTQGLVELPAQLVNASNLIAIGCTAGGENKFIITGRGGLPAHPGQSLDSDAIDVDLVTLNSQKENLSVSNPTKNSTVLLPAPLLEATGWETDSHGKVVLTAKASTVTYQNLWQPPADCRAAR